MNERNFFAETIRDGSRNTQPGCFFTLHCVLYSRTETAPEICQDAFDADVSRYLGSLLGVFGDPASVPRHSGNLTHYDLDAFHRLHTTRDGRLKCLVLRTDSDFLVLSVGTFEQPPDPRQKKFPPAEDASIRRGDAYYQFAYSYGQQLRRGDAVLGGVLEQLSVGFEKYGRILSHLRGEYFDLAAQLAGGEFFLLERTVNEEARMLQLHEQQDLFLETYAAWRRTGDEALKEALRTQAAAIREIKPDFKFTV
ncbi:MAG: hypothetical protein HZB25_13645 [Candidatus Eisenbacteria bacterium]|nr:hypothetical protein [Candidatus Eisenbacteria bacterium]